MRVEVPSLIEMETGNNYQLIGQTTSHAANHYALPTMISMVKNLANAYANFFPGNILYVNDMSLEKGGLFDYKATWAPPHKSHRFGNDVDVDTNTLPVKDHAKFHALATSQGFYVIKESSHLHLRATDL